MSTAVSEDPRTRFAAERTILAWIRTGVAMMGFGFVVARFGMFLRELAAVRGTNIPHTPTLSVWVGSGLITLGVVVNIVSAMRHAALLRRLNQGLSPVPERWSLAIIVAFILASIGIFMTIYVLKATL